MQPTHLGGDDLNIVFCGYSFGISTKKDIVSLFYFNYTKRRYDRECYYTTRVYRNQMKLNNCLSLFQFQDEHHPSF